MLTVWQNGIVPFHTNISQKKSVIIHATYDQLEHKTDRLRSNRLPEVARLADLMTETIQKTVPNFMRHKSSQR